MAIVLKLRINHDDSIKWKIFGSFLVFIGCVILILWLFQVFFLEQFYMYNKEKSLKSSVSQINTYLYKNASISGLSDIVNDNSLCVTVFDKTHRYTMNSDESHRCSIDNFQYEQNLYTIELLKGKALNNHGIASMRLNNDSLNLNNKSIFPYEFFSNSYLFMQDKLSNYKNKQTNSMTYLSVIYHNADSMFVVAVSTMLTPVDATIDTIKMQFIIIAIILVVIAIILALYLAQKIAKPIIKMNQSAHLLAKGSYDIQFNAHGYREIDELNATLNYAAKELAKVENLRKELIANMSHDLRTPLTMISGYGEVMRDIPGENTAENVQIIIEEANRLTNLVNDMLDLSKLQAGVQQLDASVFNLTKQIEAIIRRYDKLLTTQDFTIEFAYEQEVFVYADVIKIEQVIYNLINNAINYSGDERKVFVKQTITNDYVMISVIDHGSGIEKSQLPYIWDRYYKVDKTHVRSKVGSGLGLSIVKSVLELHKAQYGVKSEQGEGTCFWFKLKISKDIT